MKHALDQSNKKIYPKYYFELHESFVVLSQNDLNIILSGKKSVQKIHPLDQKKSTKENLNKGRCKFKNETL